MAKQTKPLIVAIKPSRKVKATVPKPSIWVGWIFRWPVVGLRTWTEQMNRPPSWLAILPGISVHEAISRCLHDSGPGDLQTLEKCDRALRIGRSLKSLTRDWRAPFARTAGLQRGTAFQHLPERRTN